MELAVEAMRLLKERGYTQESLADRLGKDRTTIANSLRLLKLPARVRSRPAASITGVPAASVSRPAR